MRLATNLLLGCVLIAISAAKLSAADPETAAQRGYRLLTTKAYLPPDFDDEVFAELWKTWPAAERAKAETATPAERRAMTFSRYGLIEAPERGGKGTALGYVADGAGGWVMNCLVCHGGQLMGKAVPGLPNSHYGLSNLTADVTTTKVRLKKPLGHMEMGAMGMPLGGTNGTTNAVAFGVALESFRDKDMNVHKEYPLQKLVHHDLDAPPFWLLKKKSHLYYDAFVKKGHRPLLQFILLPRNTADVLREWEGDYKDILAWIESIEPPKYPWPVDAALAAKGEKLFNNSCSSCHGTYGEKGIYPNKLIPIAEIGTDRVRLDSLSTTYRQKFGESWMAHYDLKNVRTDPGGYLAPPLDGIWASAPYLHNGSVPTLWHLFHSKQRPVVWKRTENGYDREKLGLEVTIFDKMPANLEPSEQRGYFDTRMRSKSAVGHDFPDDLTEDEKTAVLEYLKTL